MLDLRRRRRTRTTLWSVREATVTKSEDGRFKTGMKVDTPLGMAKAICSGCGKRSGMRVIGVAPEGWRRFNTEARGVVYRCPDCPGRP